MQIPASAFEELLAQVRDLKPAIDKLSALVVPIAHGAKDSHGQWISTPELLRHRTRDAAIEASEAIDRFIVGSSSVSGAIGTRGASPVS